MIPFWSSWYRSLSAQNRLIVVANSVFVIGIALFASFGALQIQRTVTTLENALVEELFNTVTEASRHAVLTGDYEDLRRVFKSAGVRPQVEWIRWRGARDAENFCIQGVYRCDSSVDSAIPTQSRTITFDPGGPAAGTIDVKLKPVFGPTAIRNLLLALAGLLIGLGVLLNIVVRLLIRDFRSQIRWLAEWVRLKTSDGDPHPSLSTLETASVRAAQDQLERTLRAYAGKVAGAARAQTLANVARQVAHDIRSPLGALKVVAADPEMDVETRTELLTVAVKRVNDIAEDLLRQDRELGRPSEKSVTSLVPLLNDLIAEKRALHLVKLEFDPTVGDGRIQCQPTPLLRVLSNLIDNAVEASPENEPVSIRVRPDDLAGSPNPPSDPTGINRPGLTVHISNKLRRPLSEDRIAEMNSGAVAHSDKPGGNAIGWNQAFAWARDQGGLEIREEAGAAVVTLRLGRTFS